MPHLPTSTGFLARAVLAALVCLATTACSTTGGASPSNAGDGSDGRRSVTIFGDIDAGVSRIR